MTVVDYLLRALDVAVMVLDLFVVLYFIVLAAQYLATSALAIRLMVSYNRRMRTYHVSEALTATSAPPVTLLVPLYNEEAVCVEAVRSHLALKYPRFEVLLINDGSKDETLNRLIDGFAFEPVQRLPTSALAHKPVRGVYRSRDVPHLWLIDKVNGGKADALNVGVAHCQTPLFCAIDGDSLLDRDALLRIVRPFLEDTTTAAVGGMIRIVNDSVVRSGVVRDVRMPRKMYARYQVVEYLRAFLCARTGWAGLGALLVISGAFGLFRRDLVVEIGGFQHDTVGEDMELVVRLHRHLREKKQRYRITYVPDAVVWTECPDNAKVLGRQRDRWHRGLAQVLVKHKVMLLNPRYGKIGLLAMPQAWFVELLGPVIEAAGLLVYIGNLYFYGLHMSYTAALFLLALALGTMQSVIAFIAEEMAFRSYPRTRDLWLMAGLSVLENFGYRQQTVYWRLRGLWRYYTGSQSWGEMKRTGFTTASTALPTIPTKPKP